MIVVYILLGILALLGLLMLCDVRVIIRYPDEPPFQIGFLFLHYPFKKKKNPKPVTKAEKSKPESPREKKKEPKLKIEYILRVFKEFIALLGRLSEHTRIKPCRLKIVVAEEDAAETALAYGRYCAMLGTLDSLLKANFSKVQTDFDVKWDFEPQSAGTQFDLKLVLKIRLFRIVASQFWKPMMLLAEMQGEDNEGEGTGSSGAAPQKQPVKSGK